MFPSQTMKYKKVTVVKQHIRSKIIIFLSQDKVSNKVLDDIALDKY